MADENRHITLPMFTAMEIKKWIVYLEMERFKTNGKRRFSEETVLTATDKQESVFRQAVSERSVGIGQPKDFLRPPPCYCMDAGLPVSVQWQQGSFFGNGTNGEKNRKALSRIKYKSQLRHYSMNSA